MTPTLTINAGARWDVQLPFEATNDILSMSTLADACGVSGQNPDGSCRFFDPTATGGKSPTFVQYDKSNPGWNTDWNNIAPNISAAWRPNVQGGWLRPILGDPEQATLRARLLDQLRPRRHGGLHRPVRGESRQPGERHPEREQRTARAALARPGPSSIPAIG